MKDYSLPGYKYLGPGNSLKKGRPVNKNDEIAFKHDLWYDKYIKRKQNPYINWNQADETARKRFTWDDYGGALGKIFFGGKRIAHEAGFIGSLDTRKTKRLRGSQQELQRSGDLSLNNLQTQGNAMDSNSAGSGNDGSLKETPIHKQPKFLETGPEKYTYAKLPYNSIKNYRGEGIYSADMAFRMTSPYDPEMFSSSGTLAGSGGTFVITPNASDPDGGTNIKANYFDFYAGMYKYYHVVNCKWSLIVENTSGEPLYVHQMYYNEQLPPQGATNTDIMGWQGVRTRILHPQYKGLNTSGVILTNELPPQAAVTTGGDLVDTIDETDASTNASTNFSDVLVTNKVGSPITELSGSYSPGQFNREVILDDQVENWTLVNTNPKLPERLLFRFKPENPALNSVTTRGDIIAFKAWFKCEYICEFYELQDGLRYPVQRQPILVSVQTNQFTSTS
nr:MAG: capsid protein [Phoenicopteridae parvo-like hybrid virus]